MLCGLLLPSVTLLCVVCSIQPQSLAAAPGLTVPQLRTCTCATPSPHQAVCGSQATPAPCRLHLCFPAALLFVPRPLFFYVVMELLALVCHAALLATGFRHHRMGDVSYYSFNIGPQKVVRAIRWDSALPACCMIDFQPLAGLLAAGPGRAYLVFGSVVGQPLLAACQQACASIWWYG